MNCEKRSLGERGGPLGKSGPSVCSCRLEVAQDRRRQRWQRQRQRRRATNEQRQSLLPCLLPLLRHSTPLPPKFSSSCPGLFSTLHRPVLSSRSPPAALQNPPPHIDTKGEEEVEMAKRRGKQGRLMGREKSGGGTKSATNGRTLQC